MHILCIILNNAFLSFTHIGNLTLNSNVTCDSIVGRNSCINIIQDGITLDCNGYSIIGPGHENSVGFFVFGNNVIIKNCNVENFRDGIQTQSARGLSSALQLSQLLSQKTILGLIRLKDPSRSRTYWLRITEKAIM